MSHHHHHHARHSTNNLKVVFFLNAFFTLVEIGGGWYTNSVAIFSDALHDMGDTLALGVAWYLQNLASKAGDKFYSYGYGRFSILGSIITSLILVIGSIFIIQESIPRFFNPVNPHTGGMIWLAVLGIVINGAAVFRLKDSTGLNEKTAMLHLLEDVLGWIIVLIGAIVMKFYHAPYIDPLLSLILAVIILSGVYKNLKQAFKIIMQATPEGVDIEEIKALLEAEPEIASVSDIHIWSTDGEFHVMTLQLEITLHNPEEINALSEKVRTLADKHHIHHTTIGYHFNKTV